MKEKYPALGSLVPHKFNALPKGVKIIDFDKEKKRIWLVKKVLKSDLVRGHFPDPLPSIVRGTDTVEWGAIFGAALEKMLHPEFPENALPQFRKINEAEFPKKIFRGDTLIVMVTEERYRTKSYIFDIRICNQDGDIVTTANILGMIQRV